MLERLITYVIAGVWFVNGLFCKVLNFVPRHEEIVGRILGDVYSKPLTIAIGLSEIGMAIWILTGYKSRLNAILQIVIIALMNFLEFILVPDLLLWGRFNSLFAFLFIFLIYFKEFKLQSSPINA
ncbi:DoxX-like family protein [Pedobacter gandavensis]|uniref:DoxX-like family protein n=1 Tax=Pedobacter gandavensis TaxID=2679963 RepID=UPI00292DF008|nr:DoxX-like family protein [Pedobacter gandavensis]